MCVCVNLCSTRLHIRVRLHSNAINITENIIFLHVQLDCNVAWQSHINYLIKTLISISIILTNRIPVVNAKVLGKIYFAHFYSQICIGVLFWYSSLLMRNVFFIQKRAIRIILRLVPRSSCRVGFKKFDILTVPGLYV
jgi:hypothetical protein